ncbi:hypothetical protein D927_02158 [Enterococcus faecalis 02-MB-BW-10]|nr:hypothetical protein D927_02158 [Enterococcus faecalis 02-MB-BW-10]
MYFIKKTTYFFSKKKLKDRKTYQCDKFSYLLFILFIYFSK